MSSLVHSFSAPTDRLWSQSTDYIHLNSGNNEKTQLVIISASSLLTEHFWRVKRQGGTTFWGNQERLGGDLLPKALGRGGKAKADWKRCILFSLRKRKASITSAPETAETFVFHVHTELTWALVPGWIRGRGGVFRVIVASRLIFLTSGFHLFKERMILFKTELEITGGERN